MKIWVFAVGLAVPVLFYLYMFSVIVPQDICGVQGKFLSVDVVKDGEVDCVDEGSPDVRELGLPLSIGEAESLCWVIYEGVLIDFDPVGIGYCRAGM